MATEIRNYFALPPSTTLPRTLPKQQLVTILISSVVFLASNIGLGEQEPLPPPLSAHFGGVWVDGIGEDGSKGEVKDANRECATENS